MNDKLEQLYNLYKQNGIIQSTDFNKFASADENQRRKLYDLGRQKGLFKTTDFNTFNTAFEPVKKKETTESPSVQKQEPISSVTPPKEPQKPSVSSVSKKPKIKEGYTLDSPNIKVYSGLPGRENIQYRYKADENKWQKRGDSGWNDVESKYYDYLTGYFKVKTKKDITKELESNVKKAEAEKELSDKELASVLGWSEQEVKKAKAGSGTPDKDFKAAMAKPDIVDPSKSKAISTMAISAQKASSDLGPNANSEQIKERAKYYETIETQKYLKSIGYDVDVNGNESDEKTKNALNKQRIKQDVITKDAFKAADAYQSIDNDINQNLLSNNEEFVVTELRKKYSKDGFSFEETGAGNAMIVKYSPLAGVETRQIEIPLNTSDINNVNTLKEFMKQSYMTASERKELNETDFEGAIKLMADNPYKYGTSLLSDDDFENHMSKTYDNLKQESKSLQEEYKNLQSRIDNFSKDPSDSKERAYINNKIYELSQKELQINNRYNDLSAIDKNINKIASINYDKAGSIGNWVGVLGSQFIQGIANVEKAVLQTSMDVLPYAIGENIVDPFTRQQLKDKGYTDTQILDYASKDLKNNLYKDIKEGITNVSSLGTTTSQYINSEDRNDLLKAASFLAESIGTSLSAGGNPTLQKIAFFTQSYNAMEEQMMGPQFDGLNEWQKKLISVPYGFVIGALERYGIAALGQGGNPVINRFATAIVNRTLLSLPKNATVDTIKREINKNVGAMIAQGALRVVGGALVEGGTEATQQLFEVGEKFVVNKIIGKDKETGLDYFKDTPDITTASGLKKAFELAGTDFYYGALGGLLMAGGTNAYETIKQNSFNKRTDQEFEAFYDSMTDDKLRKLNILNTKLKLKNGEITKEEAKETIDAINSSAQKLKSLNANLSLRDKKDAFNLMLERDRLQQEKAPLDEAMQAPYNERINNINNELKIISENAVKESTKPVQEVTAEGGGIQREGTQERQPEVREGERPVGETAQPETDLGNRPVEGRGTQEEVEALKDVESTARALQENEDRVNEELLAARVPTEQFKRLNVAPRTLNDIIAEAYHEDKIAGKETRLTKGVEDFFGIQTEAISTEPTAVGEAVVEQPVVEQPVVEQPVVEQPVVEQPVVEQPVVEQPVVEQPVVEQPVVEQPVVEQPVVEQPVVEEAVVAEEVERLGKLLEGTDEQIEEEVGKLKISKDNNKVAQSIANAAKSITKILPDVKFVVHDTDASYRQATNQENRSQSSAGQYNPKTRTIHINNTKANNRTAAHEVFHAVLLEGVANDAEAQRLTKTMIDAVMKSLVNVQGSEQVVSYLNDFASNYEENVRNEEKLAELFGIMSDGYQTLPVPTQSLIRRFLDRIAKMFGLKPMTDREVIQFMNSLSFDVESGTEIQANENISKVSAKETVVTQEQKATRQQIDNSFEAREQKPKGITAIINAARQNGFSDAAIEQYLLGQGYSQQEITNAMTSRPASGTTIDDIFEKSQEEIEAKYKKPSIFKRFIEGVRSFRRSMIDRQTDLKRGMRGIKNKEAKQAYAKLVTKAGASGFAGVRFKIASKKIYGKLKESEVKVLDKIIYNRRMISINENRAKLREKAYDGLTEESKKDLDNIVKYKESKNTNELNKIKDRVGEKTYKDLLNRSEIYKNPYTGINGFNETDAQMSLENLRAELGEKKFNDLNRRADLYFDEFSKNLKKLKDSGRINEETYNNLKDVEYSPIKTIKYIISDNQNLADIDREAARLGITKEDIKSLTDKNENGIITDSRWLLMMNINMVENRAFENQMINEMVDAIEKATPQEKAALSDYFILDNPIVGSFKDGRAKRKYDSEAMPDGYRKVHYFKDGVDNYIIAREDIARQILDVKQTKVVPAIEQFSKDVPILGWFLKNLTLTPSRLLRFFATGGNPFFIAGNVAMDWANAVFFNDVYSHKWYEQFKLISGAKAAWGFVKNFTKTAISKGEWNKVYMEYAEHGGLMESMSQEGLRALQEMKPDTKTGRAILAPIRGAKLATWKLLMGYGKAMSYLGETSEIAMRLAVYEKMKKNLIDDYKKENNGQEPTGKALDDIMWEASREARELIDFNQGGTWAKEVDVFMPYFNASMQGFRKPLDFAEQKPVQFASGLIQLAGMAGVLAGGSIAAALAAFDDDDEEEKKKKVKFALDSISVHEKANYHIIFTGNVDKNGELEYIRIKKLPVASIISTAAENLIYQQYLGYGNEKVLGKTLRASMPIWPTEIPGRNPMIAAIVAYNNYDLFTEEQVFKAPKNKKILPIAEGIEDDRVEAIYKSLAPSLGLSPARSKAFVEKIITNESTNPTINIIYAAGNGIFDRSTPFGENFKIMAEELLKHSERKFVRKTNKDIVRYSLQDEFEKKEMERETEIYLKEQKVYNQIKKVYDEGGSLTVGELENIVEKNFDKARQLSELKKYYAYARNMNIDKSMLDIIYEENPEVQSMRIYERYGNVIDKEEVKELGQIVGNTGKRISPKTWYYYEKEFKGKIQ